MSQTLETVRVVSEPYGFKVINKCDLTEADVLYVEPTEQPQQPAPTESIQQKKRGK